MMSPSRILTYTFMFLTILTTFLVVAESAHGALHLKQGTIDGMKGENPAVPTLFEGTPTDDGADGYRIIELPNGLSATDRTMLENQGIEIVRYIPDNGYIVRGSGTADGTLWRSGFSGPVFVHTLHPWLRVDPRIYQLQADLEEEGRLGETVMLRLCLFPGESLTLVRGIVASENLATIVGATDIERSDDSALLLISLPAALLDQAILRLASLPGLEMVLPHPRMVLHNNEGIWIHQSFISNSTPLFSRGLTGHGQIVAVSDSGLDEDECYFYDTVHGYSPIVSTSPFTGTPPDLSKRKVILYMNMGGDGRGDADSQAPAHGTHTAGSITGDNYATPAGPNNAGHDNGDGMAPAAKLVEQDLGGSLEYLNNGGNFAEVLEAAWVAGARVHSNSWGASCCNFFLGCAICYPYEPLTYCNVYDDFARDADLKMWQHPDMLVLVAAGNDGSCGELSIGTPATAKNILSVGATNHGTSATSRASFSGQGLCYDNRMKPTVMGQGVDVVSAAGNNVLNPPSCSTRTLGGTSMACPTIAGNTVLARQYYTDGYYPTGSAITGNAILPSAALVKATIIQSSRDMTGVSGSPPNSLEGYGRVTLDDVLYFSGDATKLLVLDSWAGIKEKNSFTTTGSRQYTVNVHSSSQSLKVTLVWTDPPAALAASPALVNDLNLSVTTPSGARFFRDADGAIHESVNARDDSKASDAINVEEQVILQSPLTPGVYTITVQAARIVTSPQHYALVVSGDVTWQSSLQAVPVLSLAAIFMLLGLLTVAISGHRRKKGRSI